MSTNRKCILGAFLGSMLILPAAAPARVAILPTPVPPDDDVAPVCPEPPMGYIYRWVPPVYRTIYDRVWVPEFSQRVLDWVEVAPGRWEERWTIVTIAAHWETTARRVLVAAGYWQLIRIEPPPRPIPLPHPVVISGTVGVDGYARQGGEDLSKFSPLYDWPDKK